MQQLLPSISRFPGNNYSTSADYFPASDTYPVKYYGHDNLRQELGLGYFKQEESQGDFRGENEPRERKRISRACDQCNKRKVRCDAGYPSCLTCRGSQAICSYRRDFKKRGPKARSDEELSPPIGFQFFEPNPYSLPFQQAPKFPSLNHRPGNLF